jgi:hypothetical protein
VLRLEARASVVIRDIACDFRLLLPIRRRFRRVCLFRTVSLVWACFRAKRVTFARLVNSACVAKCDQPQARRSAPVAVARGNLSLCG